VKVLHLAPGGTTCGIATYTANLIKYFPDDGDVSHELLPIPPKSALAGLSEKEMREWAKEIIEGCEGYDFIHIQNEFGLFQGPGDMPFALSVFYDILKGLISRKHKIAVTFHSEPMFLKAMGALNFENKKCARIWKKTAKLFTKKNNCIAILHSEVSENIFKESGFKNTTIIIHGVLERSFDKRRQLKKSDDSVVLSLFGYISDYKGHEFALSILELLPPNFKLSIVGGRHPESSGEEIGRLLKLATEMGLIDRVLISGWVSPEEADFYQQNADICLAPYQTQELSASGAITWSLTSQKPVIASNINAFRNINRESQCMLLCHPYDRLEWIWAIKKVVENKDFSNRIVKNANEYCDKYSWTNTSLRHLKIYER
tara:strand:+ start:2590 stop:3708 length:1119 start_codon:yes stop_codon:yes gene_type:complete